MTQTYGLLLAIVALMISAEAIGQHRARDMGISPGILTPGVLNAITDVAGVKVGLARTGASITNGSGDYVIAFSNAESVRRRAGVAMRTTPDLANSEISPLFQAVAEATEEAVYNSLLQAGDVSGYKGTIKALPRDKIKALLQSSR